MGECRQKVEIQTPSLVTCDKRWTDSGKQTEHFVGFPIFRFFPVTKDRPVTRPLVSYDENQKNKIKRNMGAKADEDVVADEMDEDAEEKLEKEKRLNSNIFLVR